MYRLFVIGALLLTMMSCSKGGFDFSGSEGGDDAIGLDMIVLGDRLDNPYTVENVSAAVAALYPERGRVEVEPTHLYVRFLPTDQKDFDLISDLDLSDHPLDYEIVRDGDYYHDPDISEDKATWQYAVVPEDYVFPDIYYEIIDKCFITENDAPERSGDGIDWAAVERESYRLTGNGDMLETRETRAKTKPKGRITIVDDNYIEGKPFGVAGVRVRCNTFVKYSHAYTDRDGYYTIPKSFSAKVRYRLIYKNEKGFSIGFNKLIVPASTSALGKSSPEGLDYTVTPESGRKMFSRCVVNNSVYDYILRCDELDMGIAPPPGDLRLWLFPSMTHSASVMIHHKAFVEGQYLKKLLGMFTSIVAFFAPDITLGTKGLDDYGSLYAAVCHEMAHASHFSSVGTDFWNKYILYFIKSYIASGDLPYGTGNETDAGHCAVSEMWACHIEDAMYRERYGVETCPEWDSYWFSPQILSDLERRGFKRSEIFDALQKDVTDAETLITRLKMMYPDRETLVDQSFNKYRKRK